MRFSHLAPLSAMLLLIGCGDADPGNGEVVEADEDALTLAQCRQRPSDPTCLVEAAVVDEFIGEVDPFVVGDVCVLVVKQISGNKTWGLVEDFDTCTATQAHGESRGAVVQFSKGHLSPIGSAAQRELKELHPGAVFHNLNGSVAAVAAPDNAFTLACKPKGNPCRKESQLGFCIDAIDVMQVTDDKVTLIVKTSTSGPSGTRPRATEVVVPKRTDIGGRSDEGALPETVRVELEGGHAISLGLDEDDLAQMTGGYEWQDAAHFPGEFESLPLVCKGSL
jgi:hypothetical protein